MTDLRSAARRLAWVSVLLLSLLAIGAPGARADTSIEIAALPSEMTLSQGSKMTGILRIANGGAEPLTVDLSAVPSSEALRVSGPSPAQVKIPAGGSRTAQFDIQYVAASQDKLLVHFLAQTATSDVVATLSITPAATPDNGGLKAEFLPSGGSDEWKVSDYRPLRTTLLISNDGDTPLTVNRVDIAPIEGIRPTVDLGLPRTIRPDSQTAAEVTLVVEEDPKVRSPTPGSRTLTVSVEAESGTGQQVSRVASQGFEVVVFAESAILQALGVPILLLVPGLIILAVSVFLIANASPWRSRISSPDVPKDLPLVAIVSVAISLAFAKVYPSLTKIIPGSDSRDYLRFQSFEDFYWVFLWAFLLSLAIWLAAVLSGLAKPFWVRTFGYELEDRPGQLLRKALNRYLFGGRLQHQLVRVDATGKGVTLRAPVPKGQHFVSPRLWLRANTPKGEDVLETVRSQVLKRAASPRERWERRRPWTRYELRRDILRALENQDVNATYRAEDLPRPIVAEVVTSLGIHPTSLIFLP